MTGLPLLRGNGYRLRVARDLYAYFRGAEYPLGRLTAAREAVVMAFIVGWPVRALTRNQERP